MNVTLIPRKMTLAQIGKGIIARIINRYKYFRDSEVQFPEKCSEFSNCVIGNAPPKSGTYLLNSILNYLDNWNNTGIHLLDSQYIDFGDYKSNKDTPRIYRPAVECLSNLKNGQLVAAHLTWNQELDKALSEQRKECKLKHILMIRDPRDTAVSYMKYKTYAENYVHDKPTRKFRKFMLETFKNDDERLEYVIKKRLVNPEFLGYVGWFHHSNTYLLRFEELYPELCNLDSDGFGPVLRGLCEYLEVDIDRYDELSFQSGVLGHSLTSSGLKNKIGQYKPVFKEQHYALLDNRAFKENLEKFGYSW
jgi:hypothetical protein